MKTHYTIYASTESSVEWRAQRLVDENPQWDILLWDMERNGEAKEPGEAFVGTLIVEGSDEHR